MLNNKDITLIDKYLENNLSEDESRVFKEHFETNPEFAKEVKQQTDLRIALKSIAKHRIQSKPKTKKIPFRYYVFAFAASIILLISFSVDFNAIFGKTDHNQNLYADFYQNPLENNSDFVTRGTESEADKQAMEKFKKAISLMESENFEDAAGLLEELYNSNNNILLDEVSWYLALAYLRTGKSEEANKIFIDLYNSNSIYSNESLEIYNKLDSNK